MNLSKAFYRFNFWFGILIFIIPIVSNFVLSSDITNYFYGRVESDYITKEYIWYKIGGFISNTDGFNEAIINAVAYFIFYISFLIFYIRSFIVSFSKIGSAFDSIKTLEKTKKFVLGCPMLYLGVNIFGISDNDKSHGISFLELMCWGLCFILYFCVVSYYQKYILNNFYKYINLFIILCFIPFLIIIFCKHLTLLNYQLLFFTNPTHIFIKSPWIYVSLIFSPISYMALPLFFSFNHYMSVKKLIMENTKKELPKDFFNFKFSFNEA